ncbi:hypothetical protein MPH_09227 [Macrophomina phaseolina MS6]|uniref:Uncharacterized protein n=1 Tax=Macrophomina phaseolina (strain MS6) TaxID=1126212 RepID=K2RG90_MACPH|nr:hypothetical protein MPH_09227 [Macrophomina phaseolina MS6]
MRRARGKTAKRLAKGEIANNVERGPREPLQHVLRPRAALAVQARHEPVHMLLDERLLRGHGLRAERVRKQPAVFRVVFVVGGPNGRLHARVRRREEVRVLLQLRVALAEAVDVFPRRVRVVGQLVWGDADDRAISPMECRHCEREKAQVASDDVWQPVRCEQAGARVRPQGM